MTDKQHHADEVEDFHKEAGHVQELSCVCACAGFGVACWLRFGLVVNSGGEMKMMMVVVRVIVSLAKKGRRR